MRSKVRGFFLLLLLLLQCRPETEGKGGEGRKNCAKKREGRADISIRERRRRRGP